MASQLPLPVVLEAFCRDLRSIRTYKSYKNDISRLRIFFGPICDSLKNCPPGTKRRPGNRKPMRDKYAGRHVQAELLENIAPQIMKRFFFI